MTIDNVVALVLAVLLRKTGLFLFFLKELVPIQGKPVRIDQGWQVFIFI